jgi:oligoendopeptidase F
MRLSPAPLALLALCAGAVAAPTRWRLDDLYPSLADWQADARRLEAQLGAFGAECRGHLGDSARRLARCLDAQAASRERLARLDAYASLLADEDTSLAAPLELRLAAERLGTQADEAGAFVAPELLALGRARIERFVAREPALAPHRYPLRRLLDAAPHTLDAKGEALLATLGEASGGGEAVFSILSSADMPRPRLRLADGSEIVLDEAAYEKHRQSADRDERKRVMDAFFGTWKGFERSFGTTFYEMLKRDRAYAKVRRYPDALAQRLDQDRLPRAVVDTLLAQANGNLPTLHRYLRLRAHMLGVERLGYHDLYVPLVDSDAKFPLERSQRLLLDAVKPLGEPYVAALREGLEGGWMDVYPRPRKRSGGYMRGDAYAVHPYLLLNHNDDYESLTTLAHEWGHAMHSRLANRAQPFVTAGYATFVAEIASTLDEALLCEHMLAVASSDEERLFYLGNALEGLRTTFFRQAMFTDFEREAHALAERGEPVSGERLSRLYGEVMRRYYGEREGVTAIDQLYDVEWAYIPHFYNAFYVFQYATSIAASSLLADELLQGQPGARERVLGLLAAGGSDDPYVLVRRAGVDLADAAPYRALFERMNRLMDEIEAILARRPHR